MKKRRSKRLFSLFLSFLLVFSFFSTASAKSDLKGHWAEAEITEWLEKGLVKGFPDGSIRPGTTISKAEFITFVNRAFGIVEQGNDGFKDVSAKEWYYGEVLKAKAAGYISGDNEGNFHPKSPITRQEVAVAIGKLLGLEENPEATARFKDAASIKDASKGYIGAVAEKGYMVGYDDGEFKPLNHLTRAEAIVSLDRVLKSVIKTFDKAGTYGPAEGTETIRGNVSISAADVSLQNLVIEGNLTIEESVGDGDVYLKGVTVKGQTYVNGGGENSIHFENTILLTVVVNKADGTVRIVASGSTVVQQVVLQSSAMVEDNAAGAGFQAVELAASLPANSIVTLLGEFESVDILAATISVSIPRGVVTELNVGENAAGASINLAAEAKVVSLVLNAAASVLGAGTIDNADVNANGTSFAKAPGKLNLGEGITSNVPSGSSSGSSGSGGSTGGGGPVTPPPSEEPGEPDTVIEKLDDELIKEYGKFSASFTWKSNNGIGSIDESKSGAYNYYDDGAYLRFQVKGPDGAIKKFAEVFETYDDGNNTEGGMTLQTNDGNVNDMDGSKRERADWGVEDEELESYKTNLPNDGNYVFYGLIQNKDVGTKTVGFNPGDERTVNMTLTPRLDIELGEYTLIIETLQQGSSEVHASITYSFEVFLPSFAFTFDENENGKIDYILVALFDIYEYFNSGISEEEELVQFKGYDLTNKEIEVVGYTVESAKTISFDEFGDVGSDSEIEGTGDPGELLIIKLQENNVKDTGILPTIKFNPPLETTTNKKVNPKPYLIDLAPPAVEIISEPEDCGNCIVVEFSEEVNEDDFFAILTRIYDGPVAATSIENSDIDVGEEADKDENADVDEEVNEDENTDVDEEADEDENADVDEDTDEELEGLDGELQFEFQDDGKTVKLFLPRNDFDFLEIEIYLTEKTPFSRPLIIYLNYEDGEWYFYSGVLLEL